MTDKELAALIQTDPDQGIHVAIEMYGKPVQTICRNYLSDMDHTVIEEATSEVFVRVWRYIERYQPEKASLKSYIYQIARNSSLDIRKKYIQEDQSFEEGDELISGLNVEDEFARRRNQQIVKETIEELEEPDRSIFVLRFFYNCRVKEIAQRLMVTPKTVENHLMRGKKQLKETLMKRGVMYE